MLRVKPSFISNLVHDIVSIYGPQLSRGASSNPRGGGAVARARGCAGGRCAATSRSSKGRERKTPPRVRIEGTIGKQGADVGAQGRGLVVVRWWLCRYSPGAHEGCAFE